MESKEKEKGFKRTKAFKKMKRGGEKQDNQDLGIVAIKITLSPGHYTGK